MTGIEKVREWNEKCGVECSDSSGNIAELFEEYLRENSEAVAKPLLALEYNKAA